MLVVWVGGLVNLGMAGELDRGRFGEVVDLGEPLTNISIQHCVVGTEEGEPVAYFTVAGRPAVFHVVDVNENRLVGAYELPGAARSWNHVIAPDGTVYIGGVGLGKTAHLYRYLPEEKRVEDLGAGIPGHQFIWALAAAEDGRIYGGTWEGGHVFEFDPESGETRDLGRVDPGEDYVRAIAWHDGFVYAGTGMQNGRIWRIDPETGERDRLEIPRREEYAEHFDRMRAVYHLAVAGDHLFAFFSGPRILLIYDLKKREWWEETIAFTGGPVSGVFAEGENAFYYPSPDNAFWKVDLNSRERTRAMHFRGAFRGGEFVEVDGMPGKTLVTVFGNGAVGLLNPETGRGKTLESRATGQGTNIQALELGPGGALYLSGYMGSSGGIFDPETGATRIFPLGQAEGIVQWGDEVFYGVYPGAEIFRQYPLSGDITPKLYRKVEHRQDRPFAMTAGGDRVFVGTIPDYGELGGALMVISRAENGELSSELFPDVVAEQSIVSLAYHEESAMLFGATSISGGLGVEARAEAAKMFVWDVAAGKKVAEFSLDLAGVDSPRMIGGLSVGPDGNVWGAVNGFVFAMDVETREIVKQREIYPDVTQYGRWRPVYLRWGADGLLYANVAGRLTVVDPETMEHLRLPGGSGLMTLGPEGNIYFANGPQLKMIPVKSGGGR